MPNPTTNLRGEQNSQLFLYLEEVEKKHFEFETSLSRVIESDDFKEKLVTTIEQEIMNFMLTFAP